MPPAVTSHIRQTARRRATETPDVILEGPTIALSPSRVCGVARCDAWDASHDAEPAGRAARGGASRGQWPRTGRRSCGRGGRCARGLPAGADECAECDFFFGVVEIADAIIGCRVVASNADPNIGVAVRALACDQITDNLANIFFFADNTGQRVGYRCIGLK